MPQAAPFVRLRHVPFNTETLITACQVLRRNQIRQFDMTFTTQDVRQGINSTDYAVAKMLVLSTVSTFIVLGMIAFAG
jgi:hypothetical protein